jgi:hypothetical protein
MKRPLNRPAKFKAIDEVRRKFRELEAAQAHQRYLDSLRRQDQAERDELAMTRLGFHLE